MTDRAGRLEGKIALVTGAGSGIGEAIAALFAKEGARVAAVGRGDRTLRRWDGVDGVTPVVADITRADDVERMFTEIEARIGGVDIVANVAGINDLSYPLVETTDDRWDDVIDLDLKAPFRICRRAVPGMIERGGGAILNVGSYAALRGNHGPSYTAAKAGLTGLTRSIAVDYGSRGIRCNLLNPGAVYTDIESGSGGAYHQEGIAKFHEITRGLPVRWVCEPEEIAPTALFLCSDEARHVNAAIVSVDGGMSAC
jgi:NAD(P)-dependent dehydrogenase (short-subunit alcohol dehydrogenase family)